jgi:uncharacterized protein
MDPEFAVLLEAPRLGVMPRLAAEVGERHALRLYRILAARTLDTIEGAGLEATVWFAPPDAAATMRFWLGERRRLVPQASGDMGARLGVSLRAVAPGRGWLLVAPDIARGDPVLGPTADGGYHLLGGAAPLPDLFSAMPWGSASLLGETRARLARAARVWHELATLRRVETAADARAEGLLT